MDLAKLNDWLQIVGIFAVVASLVFVGLQLKQAQDIAIAAQYQARHDAASENIRAYMQSETALRAEGKRFAEFAKIDPNFSAELRSWVLEQPPDELAYMILQTRLDLMTVDNLYFQYQSGFLSEEAWQPHRTALMQALSLNPPLGFYRVTYELNPGAIRSSTRNLIASTIAEIDAESRQPSP